jgi:hypothetical protein
VRRGGVIACGLLAALLAASPVAGADNPPRRHRLHLPVGPLGKTLTVDEFEFALRPSKTAVSSGNVTVRVYNRGEDEHNLVLVDQVGIKHVIDLQPASYGVVRAKLARGRYKLFCSLYEGTPQSHEKKGMRFVLTVR